jgi:transposase
VIQQFDTELKTARGNFRERLLAVRAYELGYSVSLIAKLYGKTRKTVYNWITRYRENGISGLRTQPKPGRPLLVNHNDEFLSTDLRCALNHRPDESGYPTCAWTSKLFAHHIRRFYGITVSVQTAWRIIRRLGYTMQRLGRVPAGGNERARNAWRIALAIAEQNCPSDTLILFGDEAGFNIDPTIMARWAPRGRQPKLLTTGKKNT